jgi:hypothetical protein
VRVGVGGGDEDVESFWSLGLNYVEFWCASPCHDVRRLSILAKIYYMDLGPDLKKSSPNSAGMPYDTG